ncbi:MAG: glycosyltransferase family 4 protein [Boseongicola sp.]|nr:glycosyltransferase family 4 protein [Boseongicola sp.]NNJ68866.1 glycosyltransferase [Boseongicola sp.]
MKVLFVHQNCPGQFKHLAPAMAARGDEVVFITQKGKPALPGVRKVEYAPHRAVTPKIHPYLVGSEAAVLNAQAVARIGFQLRDQGFRPDVMIGNPGWGETLFLKDVWPDVPLISMSEFYYRGRGADVGFDPEFDGGADAVLRARTRAGMHLLAIEAADAAYAPTHWQRDQFPEVYRSKIRVIHDGIDCAALRPDAHATFSLPSGQTLGRDDEVLTYVARNLEPYRGFHTFMRALPELLDRRPDAQVVIIGGDGVSYGSAAPGGKSWRAHLLDEIGPLPERVHFVGRLPYPDYVRAIQVSSVHAYLTYPFVLSWSLLEVMAVGGFVVGSATPPVEEVIIEGETGWLVDFFDEKALAKRLAAALAARDEVEGIRDAARRLVAARYDLRDCLKAQLDLVADVTNPPSLTGA